MSDSLKLFLHDYDFLYVVRSNTYYDEQGKTVYKIHTPRLGGLGYWTTTTITKVVYDQDPSSEHTIPLSMEPDHAQEVFSSTHEENEAYTHPERSNAGAIDELESEYSDNGEEEAEQFASHLSPPMPHRESTEENATFMYVAQIDWKLFKDSKIRFGVGRYSGREVGVNEIFRKKGWGVMMTGHNRIFTGEDGKEYKWRYARFHSELTLNNTSNTPIATYHQKNPFNKESVGYLEVFAEGQHMLDEIIVTFTYAEGLRKTRTI